MDTYKIPLTFKAGQFRFSELDTCLETNVLDLNYKTKHQLLLYNVPVYQNEVRLYFVPQNLIPDGLCAVYDDSGKLDKIELAEAGRTRLVYRHFKDISSVKESILEYVYEQAEKMCVEIARKKQPLARLFIGIYYDGQAFEIGVKTATAKEMKAVFDKYGQDPAAADDCDQYPRENILLLLTSCFEADDCGNRENILLFDGEPLNVMLLCTDIDAQQQLFDLAVSAIREQILSKFEKTDDFKVIVEIGD